MSFVSTSMMSVILIDDGLNVEFGGEEDIFKDFARKSMEWGETSGHSSVSFSNMAAIRIELQDARTCHWLAMRA